VKLSALSPKPSLFFYVCFLLLMTISTASFAEEPQTLPQFPDIALVNSVCFKDSTFNNDLAGCSFLILAEGDTLACTCKHAMWVAKSDVMNGIHFEDSLVSWIMHPKFISDQMVVTDQLLNTNRDEAIGPENVNADWLVFSIARNTTNVAALTIRNTPLTRGEPLFAIGWAFKDREGPQRVYPYEYIKTVGNKLLLENKGPFSNRAGLSGGPIVDSRQRLVGIVSDFTADPVDGKMYFSPCSTEYLKEVLDNLIIKKDH